MKYVFFYQDPYRFISMASVGDLLMHFYYTHLTELT